MVRIGISVEGTTEERFIKTTLQPYLAQKGIFLFPRSLRGHVNVERVGHELSRLSHSFDFITTFYDFYGFQRKQAGETKASLEERILASVTKTQRNKCIPYIQCDRRHCIQPGQRRRYYAGGKQLCKNTG